MSDRPLTVEQVLALLPAAPERMAAATAGLAPAQLTTSPGPGEWSLRDVLAHLRACADVWGGCIGTILAQDTPKFKAVNPRTWIQRTDYLQLEFRPSFSAYTAQRADLLVILNALPPKAWQRWATVYGAGKTLERSVLSYAEWLATHERSHLKQIERIAQALRESTETEQPHADH